MRPAGMTSNFEMSITKFLIVEIRQAQAKSPVQVARGGAFLDLGDDLFGLIDCQRASLIDQLTEHPITFLGIFLIR